MKVTKHVWEVYIGMSDLPSSILVVVIRNTWNEQACGTLNRNGDGLNPMSSRNAGTAAWTTWSFWTTSGVAWTVGVAGILARLFLKAIRSYCSTKSSRSFTATNPSLRIASRCSIVRVIWRLEVKKWGNWSAVNGMIKIESNWYWFPLFNLEVKDKNAGAKIQNSFRDINDV